MSLILPLAQHRFQSACGSTSLSRANARRRTIADSTLSNSQRSSGCSRRAFLQRILLLAALFGAVIPASPATAGNISPAAGWKAGVAKTVITPSGPMWMSGYASRNKPAEGKSTDLWAKAVVLEDPAGGRVVLVTLDLVGIGRDTSLAIREVIETSHGLKRSQVAISTSHTHSGPVVGNNLTVMLDLDANNQKLINDYVAFLKESVVSVVDKAIASVAPAVIRIGEGQASFAVNRRNNKEADVPALRAAGQLVGPVDHAAPVLAVRTPEGALRAIVFGYACHATVVSFFDWSGDWPGFAQMEVENQHPEAVALFWAGCGADQNPLPRRSVEFAQEYGRQMAASVERTLHSPMPEVQGTLKTAYREIDLALAELPSREQVEKDLKATDVYIARRAKMLKTLFERDGKLAATYPYPIQMWGIGDNVDMFILGGEVVVDYSLRIKRELGSAGAMPSRHTWVAGYSNDVMAYIPSLRVLTEGGYEGASSMVYYGIPTTWSKDVEEHILRTARELQEELRASR